MNEFQIERNMPLFTMLDLNEKKIIVEFNRVRQRTFISAELYKWLFASETKEKLSVKGEHWLVCSGRGWYGTCILMMMVGGEKVFLRAGVRAEIYSEDDGYEDLQKVSIVVGSDDIKDEGIYLNHKKRVVRVRESQNLRTSRYRRFC